MLIINNKIINIEIIKYFESSHPLICTGFAWWVMFSLCVIHKEGLCPSSGDINSLMIMMMIEIGKDTHKMFLILNEKVILQSVKVEKGLVKVEEFLKVLLQLR
jgi:hypothetical protein